MRCGFAFTSFRVLFTSQITAPFLLFHNTDGVWSWESPNEVSPFTEHWGQPKHPAPLPERSSSRPSRQLQLHWICSAREHHASLSWLEQTDVWERHVTWTRCATGWLQGDEPGRKLMCEIPHLSETKQTWQLVLFHAYPFITLWGVFFLHCDFISPISFLSLSDPRWQLAQVTFFLPHSGQPSATYCRHTDISCATAQYSALHRNQPSLLLLTPASLLWACLHER